MSTQAEDAELKKVLLSRDDHYRQLAEEHRRYDTRLTELSNIHFPNAEEQLEEATLKKKKLALKDLMEQISARHRQASIAV
jgi:uncharacterized protein YdcH (DUF465 family)